MSLRAVADAGADHERRQRRDRGGLELDGTSPGIVTIDCGMRIGPRGKPFAENQSRVSCVNRSPRAVTYTTLKSRRRDRQQRRRCALLRRRIAAEHERLGNAFSDAVSVPSTSDTTICVPRGATNPRNGTPVPIAGDRDIEVAHADRRGARRR